MINRTLNNYKVELNAADEANKPATVHIKARSNKKVFEYFDEYEDLAGMIAPEIISLNVDHDTDRTIGKAFNFQITEYGLECDAEIFPDLPVVNGDGQRIINMLKCGIPLQASITFTVDSQDDIEEIDEGATAEVNNQTISGPAIIYRKWYLRSLAVCIHGADNETQVEAIELSNLKLKERFMKMKKQRSEQDEDQEKKGQELSEEGTPETAPETAPETPAWQSAIDELRAEIEEIKKAIAEFKTQEESEEEPIPTEDKPKEESDDCKDDEDKKELARKMEALENSLKQLNDNFVKSLSLRNAESAPVGYVDAGGNTPKSGSLRFSAIGVPHK